MSEPNEDLEVLSNRQFMIELVNGGVLISDGNGRKGGNARGRGSEFRIKWTNQTGHLCRLTFQEWIVRANGDLDKVGLWPFANPEEPDNRSGNQLDIPAQGNGSSPGSRTVTLRSYGERVVIKYDVVVNPDAPVAEIDPMIVVER